MSNNYHISNDTMIVVVGENGKEQGRGYDERDAWEVACNDYEGDAQWLSIEHFIKDKTGDGWRTIECALVPLYELADMKIRSDRLAALLDRAVLDVAESRVSISIPCIPPMENSRNYLCALLDEVARHDAEDRAEGVQP